MTDTPITDSVAACRRAFDRGVTRPLRWRRQQLEGLGALLRDDERRLLDALHDDLGKPPFEAWLAEISSTRDETDHARARLGRWVRPRRVATALANLPGYSRVVPEPLGVALIVAPWNYPLYLCLTPLVSAIAAGNAVLLKPSELAPATAALLAERLPLYVDGDAVRVVPGDGETARGLIGARVDQVFFTGSAATARQVLAAAAEHLTPVTLELGGKNPCIVDRSADLRRAARRIAWGKFLNAGQTCVAPDYVLVDAAVERPLTAALGEAIARFYGPDPLANPDYPRVANRAQFERLNGLLAGTTPAFGGATCNDRLLIAPTLLSGLTADAPVMRSELFGPILPILPVADIGEAIGFVNARPKPLALYLFSRDARTRRDVIAATSSGGVCVNDVVMQLVGPELPFGGVGASGTGRYHGKAGFETFSHLKSVLVKPSAIELPLRYPPYGTVRQRLLRFLIRQR